MMFGIYVFLFFISLTIMIYIYNYQKNVRIHIWQTNEMCKYIGDMKLKIDEIHEMMHLVIQEMQENKENK